MNLDLIAIRRDFHRHPEVAFTEERTAAVITGHLQSLGLQPRRCAGTGVVADINGGRPGPVIALRADIDALPVSEATELPFASVEEGKSHACGHDAHAAILLGAAELLAQTRAEWPGTVRLLFQPAEEVTGGAATMIEAGALAGVQAIFGLHNEPSLSVGRVAVRPGVVMAASDRFIIEVNGKGGHAAMPHQTTDPLLAAAAIVMGLQTVVSRAIDPVQPAVVSVAQFAAGTVFNVIPDHAVLKGTTRHFGGEVGERLPQLLETVAGGIAAGYRCSARVDYKRMVPPVTNDPSLVELVRAVCQAELGAANVGTPNQTMGAEDFSLYQQQVPGCFFRLGSASSFGLHHPAFALDEGCLHIGATLLAQVARAALAR